MPKTPKEAKAGSVAQTKAPTVEISVGTPKPDGWTPGEHAITQLLRSIDVKLTPPTIEPVKLVSDDSLLREVKYLNRNVKALTATVAQVGLFLADEDPYTAVEFLKAASKVSHDH